MTFVTENRAAFLCEPLARAALRAALTDCRQRWPFEIDGIVLLPDHLHMMCTLPEGDADYPRRLAFAKKEFTKSWLAGGGCEQLLSEPRRRTRRRGVWQRKYWEHTVLDPDDRWRLIDYMHFNPAKHGLVRCPHDWPYSSFHRFVRAGVYPWDWECVCSAESAQRTDVKRSAQRTLQNVARLAGE